MRFWFAVILLIVLAFYSSDISKFLDTFFNYPFRHVISVLIGMILFTAFNGKSKGFISTFYFYAFVFLVCGFLVLWALAYFFDKANLDELKFFLVFSAGGFLGLLLLDRILTPISETLRNVCTQNAGTERELKTDIRDVQSSFKSILEYDPQDFFDTKKGWFFGLDDNGKPIYFNNKKLLHTQILGASGLGKSILLAILGCQTVQRREATFVFDPKQGGDEWLPHILHKMAKQSNRPYYFIDIRKKVAQLNLFQEVTVDQMINLLIVGFMLDDRGGDANYYRGIGQEMAEFVANNYKKGMTAKEISKEYDSYFRENKADSFARDFRKLAKVESINAIEGISLKEAMENGHVIYIAGDWEDPKHIMVQRMLLARIVQIASERDNSKEEPEQVCIMLDELSFQISKIFGDALKVIRDKGIHFILAHQSIEDLKNVPDNMDAQAFYRTVLANCPLKFTYRAVDIETAQYFSDFSGTILVDDETRTVEQTLSLTNQVLPEKQIRQTERNLIDFNMMLSLPAGTGVFFSDEVAQISKVCPIEVKKTAESKKIQVIEKPNLSAKSDVASPLIFEKLR